MTTPVSIIVGLEDYIATCPVLKANAPLYVNYLGVEPEQYSIVPLPGEGVIEWYLDDGSQRVFPFALQYASSTSDDLARLVATGFSEALSDWFELQTNRKNLPTMPTGKTPFSIEATGSGYLYMEGQSNTGIYQIQCKLTYDQVPAV